MNFYYKSRKEPRLKPIRTLGDKWYDWLINEWIPNEPDAAELMKLFLDCGCNAAVFIALVVGGEKGEKLIRKKLNDPNITIEEVREALALV